MAFGNRCGYFFNSLFVQKRREEIGGKITKKSRISIVGDTKKSLMNISIRKTIYSKDGT